MEHFGIDPHFDFDNPAVKKFWGDMVKEDKKFKKYLHRWLILYIALFVLYLFSKLSVGILLFATFLSLLFVIWLIESEIKGVHNRITMELDILYKEIKKVNDRIKQ